MISAVSRTQSREPEVSSVDDNDEVAAISAQLETIRGELSRRSERLYELQQHYSSEHFELQRCMRDLKTERMRNTGAFALLETTMTRARALQTRIAVLKERLRRYELVDDEYFDTEPIFIEEKPREAR